MPNLSPRQKWSAIAILGVIVLVGTLLRFQDITGPTMSHIEMYVPGIALPYGLSDPNPRLSLRETLTSILEGEPHPPAYYILMQGWTRLFGTDIFTLRLPSALLGIASILLIYLLGLFERDRWTGILAAGMLALNGQQIFWSQTAKMYSMACFLGLVSTVLLLLATRQKSWQWLFQILYLGVTLLGLATLVFFWPLFVTQMLWVLRGALAKKNPMLGLFQLQMLIFVVASPLISLALFQSQRDSYLDPNPLPGVLSFLQFGFLFDPDPFATAPQTLPTIAGVVSLVLGLWLLAAGLLAMRGSRVKEGAPASGPPWFLIPLAGLFAFLFILRFAKFTLGMDAARTRWVVATALIPVVLVTADLLLRRYGDRLQGSAVSTLVGAALARLPDSPSILLAILPVTMVAIITPAIPLFASRTIMLFAPYLLIILSAGLMMLVNRNRAWVIAVPLLAVIFFSSAGYYKAGFSERPTDYKGLAERWTPQINASDLILVERHWVTTPIFYYLKASRYHFVGTNYAQEISKNPHARVWVLTFEGLPMNPEEAFALKDFQAQETLTARRISVELYTKGTEVNAHGPQQSGPPASVTAP